MTRARSLAGCIFAAILVAMSQSSAIAQLRIGQAKSLLLDAPDTGPSNSDLQVKAEQGHLEQELKLAGDYYTGKDVPQDLAQSAYWYRKAADQGDPGAQVELGYFYLNGIGVDKDATQAVRWFGRAAASGSRPAKLNLAILYLKGTGVEKDISFSVKLL